MTTFEFTDYILQTAKETQTPPPFDEADTFGSAQLISGSFTMQLFAKVLKSGYDTGEVAAHLEKLYDSEQHCVCGH